MISNWGYLVLNNMHFWLPQLGYFAEAIRNKMTNLVTVAYRLDYAPATVVNGVFLGFRRIFGFIDNTINAMCRPGGGPLGEGEQAPRLSKEVQETWWTGWKKLHGLKWHGISCVGSAVC